MAEDMQDVAFNLGNNGKHNWKKRVAVLIFIFFMLGSAIVYGAKSLFNSTLLNLFGEELNLPKMQELDFDMEKFLDGSSLMEEKYTGNLIRYCNYESSQELYEDTNFLLVEQDELLYDDICLNVDTKEKDVVVTSLVQYDSYDYELAATFLVKDYSPQDMEAGFGQGELASSVYEYADNKNAFFIRDWGDGQYRVYFVTNDVLYELTIPSKKKNVENAKKIVEMIGR